MNKSIYELLLTIGAVAGVAITLFNLSSRLQKVWKWLMRRLFSHRYEVKEALREMATRIEQSYAETNRRLDELSHEMKPNSGQSFRDVVNRIESRMILFEQRQRAVMTDSTTGVFETDAEGHWIWVNRKLCRVVGRTAEEMIGSGWLNSISSNERDTVYNAWSEAVKDQREFHLDFTVTTPEGVPIPIHVRSIRMVDKDRRLAGYIGFVSVVGATSPRIDPAGM